MKNLSLNELHERVSRLNLDPDVKLARAEDVIRRRDLEQYDQLTRLQKRGEEIRNDPELQWLVEMIDNMNF